MSDEKIEQKSNTITINKSHLIFVGIIIILIVTFLGGFFIGNSYNINPITDTNTYAGFSPADKNFLAQIIYLGGICERQGFISSFRIFYNTDQNRYEGLPVCVQAGQ